MGDQSKGDVETLIDPRPIPSPSLADDGGVTAVVGTATAVIGLLTAIFNAMQAGDQARKLAEKWKSEAQLRRWWRFKKPITLPVASGPVEIVISDVDDSANIWWNEKYLWTLNRGESRGFRAKLARGPNAFWFELNNHGGHRFSLMADISQNGRHVQRARLQGDDEGKFHIATLEIIGA